MLARSHRFIAVAGNLLWLDVDTARRPDLDLLRREFGFHELALEDALRPHERAKIDAYDGYSFLVVYAASLRRRARRAVRRRLRTRDGDGRAAAPEEEAGELIRLSQLALFAGPTYLVTVHRGPIPELDEVAARWRDNIARIDRSVGALVYSLLDALVDGYFPVIDEVAELVEDVEQAVFADFDEDALQEIFGLKKALLAMRRVVGPERDVLNVLIRRDAPTFGEARLAYFQDVYDHLVRVTESLDIYRDLLGGALDAYLSMASNRLNQAMKTLTSWTIPLMAGALLAGVWGMNFEHMPELDERWGYPLALALIAGTILAIVASFRRKRWL